MADQWDKYIVQDSEKSDVWSKYAVKEPEQPKTSRLGDVGGSALGLGGAGLGAYGLAKTGIPQKIGRFTSNIVGGISNIPKVINTEKGTKFANEIRKEFVNAHTQEVNKFSNELDKLTAKYPKKSVDLTNLVSDLQTNPDISQETINILKKTPKMEGILNNPKLASKVSLKDAQDIVNHLQTKVPKNIRVNNFDLLESINTIKGQQLEAFPELELARSNYKKFIEPYNQVKQSFKFNKLLNSMKTKFGGAEAWEALKKILPENTIKKIDNYRVASRITEIPGDIPLIGRTLRSLGGTLSAVPQALQGIGAYQAAQSRPQSTPLQQTIDMLRYSVGGKNTYQEQQRVKELLNNPNPTQMEVEEMRQRGLIQ